MVEYILQTKKATYNKVEYKKNRYRVKKIKSPFFIWKKKRKKDKKGTYKIQQAPLFLHQKLI